MTGTHPGVDFALISVFVFFGFFLGLILYLRREDRREGYPLESDPGGRLEPVGGFFFSALPKTFHMPDGETIIAPSGKRDGHELALQRTSIAPGSPSDPTGNPMHAGVGPGSYAHRAKVPDMTAHGVPKIVPMRVAQDFSVAKGDKDPRGFNVVGTDGVVAGAVTDIWVDRPESMVRYLELTLASDGRRVLLPMTMAVVNSGRRQVQVEAITGAQFNDVPGLENPDQVTLYEEERIVAYYGGGFLYATPSRTEPIL